MYFVTGSLYVFIQFIYFTQPPTSFSSADHPIVLYLGICYCFVLLMYLFVLFFDFTCKWNHVVSVFVWFTSLCIISLRSIHVIPDGKILFLFYVYVISHCIFVTQLPYPLIYQWTHRLFLLYLHFCKCASVNVGVLVSFWIIVFVSFR